MRTGSPLRFYCAAEMLQMNPRRLKVTIYYAENRDQRYREELQRRIIDLHKSLHRLLKEHDMLGRSTVTKMVVHTYGISPNSYHERRKKSKSRRLIEEKTRPEDWYGEW